MISSEFITKASDAIEGFTDEQSDDEFGRFLDTQPPLTNFFEHAVQNDKKLQEFVVYWSFIAWKCYEMESPGKAITVGWEHLTAAVDDTKAWVSLVRAENVHLDPNEVEPLLRYILLDLYKRFPDGSTVSFSEKYRVLKVMKTVMFAIERAAASDLRG